MGEFANQPATTGSAVQQAGGGASGAATAGGGTAAQPGTGTGTQPVPAQPQSGGGGSQADQSGPPLWKRGMASEAKRWDERRATGTDDQLRQWAKNLESSVEDFQRAIEEEIAGANNPEQLDRYHAEQDWSREQGRITRQELHDREMARPSDGQQPPPEQRAAGPSGEAIHPGGTRTGVDESGQGYTEDPSGQRTERERFDRFGPPGSASGS